MRRKSYRLFYILNEFRRSKPPSIDALSLKSSFSMRWHLFPISKKTTPVLGSSTPRTFPDPTHQRLCRSRKNHIFSRPQRLSGDVILLLARREIKRPARRKFAGRRYSTFAEVISHLFRNSRQSSRTAFKSGRRYYKPIQSSGHLGPYACAVEDRALLNIIQRLRRGPLRWVNILV